MKGSIGDWRADRKARRQAAWRLFKKRWPQIRREVLPWVRRFVLNIIITGWAFGVVESMLPADGAEPMTLGEVFFNGPWWGIVTGTTTGYGDLYPHSIPGKWLAAYLMLSSIGLQTMVIIKGTEVMVKNPHLYSDREQKREKAKTDLILAIQTETARRQHGLTWGDFPEADIYLNAVKAVEDEERAEAADR